MLGIGENLRLGDLGVKETGFQPSAFSN